MINNHLPEVAGIILAAFNELGIALAPFSFRFFRKARKASTPVPLEVNRIAAVVCAHNEESTIGTLLTALREQTRPADTIYVVADNCFDKTAAIAGELGAVVLEKAPTIQGGKADALKFFLDRTRDENFDAFVFFDADTVPNAEFLENIIAGLKQAEMAVGRHSFEHCAKSWAEAGNSMLGHIMWHHYLEARYQNGVHSLVMGHGYGLRRAYLETLQWTPRTRTEDLALSLDVALTGASFAFCPEAQFRDKQPETWSVSWHRMRRWMTGDLQCLKFYFLPLLKEVCRGDFVKLDFLGFLLSVPSFILKAAGMLCLVIAAAGGRWQGLAGILIFDLLASSYAILSKRQNLCLQYFSIPAFYCLYLQLPWIALSTLFFPAKHWVPGRQAPCDYIKKQSGIPNEKE